MMSRRGRLVVNVAGVNAGWFACVLGAAHGLHWLGPAVVAGLLALHLALHRPWQVEVLLAVAGAAFGFAFDSLLIACGVYEAERWLLPAPLAAVWLVALWVNFALVLNVALRWLQGRWALAAALGFVGGPAAYYSGQRLGAVRLAPPLWQSLVVLGIAWAVAIPSLLWAARALRGANGNLDLRRSGPDPGRRGLLK
jgi:hypothetical protein